MYESEANEGGSLKTESAKEICKIPPRRFSVEFSIVEEYEKGFVVSANVDGVICLTKKDAMAMIENRINAFYQRWEEHKTKM